MKTKNTSKAKGKVLVALLMVMSVITITHSVRAQGYRKYSYSSNNSGGIVVGVGAGLGTRNFNVKSDIDQINSLSVGQEGWDAYFMVGGGGLRFRTGFGSFNSGSTEPYPIKQSNFTGIINTYALSLLQKPTKLFHPYLITGIDVGNYQFSGSYLPESPLPKNGDPKQKCTCGLAVPDDPAAEPAPKEPTAKTQTAEIVSTQIITGVGLEVNFRKDGFFFNMFSEMRYGMPIGTTTQNPIMVNTEIKTPLSVTFGIGVGIAR
jgi:hypothetical protein